MARILAAFTMQDMESLVYPERAEFGRGKDKQKRKRRFSLSAGQKRRLESVPRFGNRFKQERLQNEADAKRRGRNRLYGDIAKGIGGAAALGLGAAALKRYGGAGLSTAKSARDVGYGLRGAIRSGARRVGTTISDDAGRVAGEASRGVAAGLGFLNKNKYRAAGAGALVGGGYAGSRTERGKKVTSYVGGKARGAASYVGGKARGAASYVGGKAGQARSYAGRQSARLRSRYAGE
jgi:hypothetical protein